jgi:hypothetical protein
MRTRPFLKSLPEVLPNYFPPSWNMLNGSAFGPTDNFMEPEDAVNINGIQDAFSQRTADSCTPWNVTVPEEQPFDLSKVIIVGNAQCASTCSAFTTLMQERHGVKIVNFGAAKGAYSGMAGAEVLEWDALDSEVKVSRLRLLADHTLTCCCLVDGQPQGQPTCGSRLDRQRQLPKQLAVSHHPILIWALADASPM